VILVVLSSYLFFIEICFIFVVFLVFSWHVFFGQLQQQRKIKRKSRPYVPPPPLIRMRRIHWCSQNSLKTPGRGSSGLLKCTGSYTAHVVQRANHNEICNSSPSKHRKQEGLGLPEKRRKRSKRNTVKRQPIPFYVISTYVLFVVKS
jgi:hypothetical protein